MIVAISAAPTPLIIPHQEAAKVIAAHASYQSATQQNQIVMAWQWLFPDSVAFFTFCLVASTILLWLATMRIGRDSRDSGKTQADKMERSAAAMEGVAESMAINAEQIVRSVDLQRRYGEMHLRPYLTVLIGQGSWQDQNIRFEVSPRVLNTGHTPARSVHWRIDCEITEHDAIKTFRFPLPKEVCGGSIIGPQQDGFMAATLPYRVDDKLAEEVKWGTGKKMLTVWGYVSYRDQFGHRYICTFAQRFWWRPKPDGSGLIPFGVYLSKHNRTN